MEIRIFMAIRSGILILILIDRDRYHCTPRCLARLQKKFLDRKKEGCKRYVQIYDECHNIIYTVSRTQKSQGEKLSSFQATQTTLCIRAHGMITNLVLQQYTSVTSTWTDFLDESSILIMCFEDFHVSSMKRYYFSFQDLFEVLHLIKTKASSWQ